MTKVCECCGKKHNSFLWGEPFYLTDEKILCIDCSSGIYGKIHDLCFLQNRESFNKQKEENRWLAVFVPGVMANSPVYSMLAEGVTNPVLDYNENNNTNYKVEVIEAGTNQAEWGAKLTGLAAMQKFEVIFSSNPSIPDLAAPITELYPEQKILLITKKF